MTKKNRNTSRDARTGKSVIRGKTLKGGGQTWIVRGKDGRVEEIVTTAASTKVMDRAVKRFSGAMKRLADR